MIKRRSVYVTLALITSIAMTPGCGSKSDSKEPDTSSSLPLGPSATAPGDNAVPAAQPEPAPAPSTDTTDTAPGTANPATPAPAPVPAPAVIHFAEVSEKVFKPFCVRCHTPPRLSGGVNLSTYAAVKLNLAAIKNAALVEQFMPPTGPLAADSAALLNKWIESGAAE